MTRTIAFFATVLTLAACSNDEGDRFRDRDAVDRAQPALAQADGALDATDAASMAAFGDELRILAGSPMLDGLQRQRYRSDGNGAWILVETAGDGIYDALSDCVDPSDRTVLFHTGGADPTIRIFGGGLTRVFWPGAEPGEWVGEIAPAADTTAACEEALEKAGMTWPIPARIRTARER